MRGINDREKFIGYLQYYKNISSYKLYGYCNGEHIHLLIKQGKEQGTP